MPASVSIVPSARGAAGENQAAGSSAFSESNVGANEFGRRSSSAAGRQAEPRHWEGEMKNRTVRLAKSETASSSSKAGHKARRQLELWRPLRQDHRERPGGKQADSLTSRPVSAIRRENRATRKANSRRYLPGHRWASVKAVWESDSTRFQWRSRNSPFRRGQWTRRAEIDG